MGLTSGSSGAQYMHIETLRKLMKKFTADPSFVLQNLFEENKADSDLIVWESYQGSRGMSKFKAPGATTEKTAPLGASDNEAKAAFWGDIMEFDEEFLNNIGSNQASIAKKEKAKQTLARNMRSLSNRCYRRKEWMFAKMIMEGGFTYVTKKGGLHASVDYGIPANLKDTLSSGSYWTGADQTTRDILGNIQDGKQEIADMCGGKANLGICSRKTLGYMAADSAVRDLLSKDKWGDGKLYKGKRDPILGINKSEIVKILDLDDILVYDEKYENRSMAITNVAIDSTSVTVANATDFEIGAVKLFNIRTGKWVKTVISAVDAESGVLTITAIGGALAFPPQLTIVTQLVNFVPNNRFTMLATTVEGENIAAYEQAPFGNNAFYGCKIDKDETFDPEVVIVRAQDKGLPILYQEDAIYQLQVAPLTS
jgi:hypothetical protein